jgi:adenosyl cobinamide kinase/adenosyl cobinamide phosphate guanylyltransferase
MGCVLILGGARSGKSALADRMGRAAEMPVTFIATAAAGDAEMVLRIERHRLSRPSDWTTVEAPLDLQAAVRSAPPGHFVIIDCLTLWVSNLMEAGRGAEEIHRAAEALAEELRTRHGVVVSNEVGLGIVPANALARSFRDVLGAVNATFAACAERSFLMVAGRALELAPVDPLDPSDAGLERD